MAFPFLSLTGQLGLLVFPESVLVISYILFVFLWPAALSASSVSSSMFSVSCLFLHFFSLVDSSPSSVLALLGFVLGFVSG